MKIRIFSVKCLSAIAKVNNSIIKHLYNIDFLLNIPEDSLKLICSYCSNENKELSIECKFLLSELLKRESLVEIINETGVFNCLLDSILNSSDNTDLDCISSLDCLYNLVSFEENNQKIVQSNVIDILIKGIQSDNEHLEISCISLFTKLSNNICDLSFQYKNYNIEDILLNNIITPPTVPTEYTVKLQTGSILLLCRFSKPVEIINKMVGKSMIETLRKMMMESEKLLQMAIMFLFITINEPNLKSIYIYIYNIIILLLLFYI